MNAVSDVVYVTSVFSLSCDSLTIEVFTIVAVRNVGFRLAVAQYSHRYDINMENIKQ